MLKVHHLSESRSQRILWLLEELGLDYEVVRYERDPKTGFAPPGLRDAAHRAAALREAAGGRRGAHQAAHRLRAEEPPHVPGGLAPGP
ncbi:hypothetical protein ACQKGO_08245 [Corallococcus interemptor]|uniref:hypothetical protein n=1 Tax=Corallococcus interemptor TaxID=2316720 RepID=UPI003D091EBA